MTGPVAVQLHSTCDLLADTNLYRTPFPWTGKTATRPLWVGSPVAVEFTDIDHTSAGQVLDFTAAHRLVIRVLEPPAGGT